jgi:tetratricopeptide (TPR) repeat protein
VTFRYRKSIGLGKGVRLNLSKTGVGLSAGIPGLRYSVHSSGRTTRTAGLPGTGVYFRKDTVSRSGSTRRSSASTRRQPEVTAVLPDPGLFAPKDEKEFVKGVRAFMSGDHATALEHFNNSMDRDAANQHVAEEYFAGFCMVALDRPEEAIPYFESVIHSDIEIPDSLMTKYRVGGHAEVGITANVTAQVPNSNLTAALMLAELYQHKGDAETAIDVLESLGSVAPDPIFALSLAELYAEKRDWDEVIRVAEGWTANSDDATCQLLVFKARALHEKGLNDAALEVLKEALKSKKRGPHILAEGHYLRGLAYEATGKAARARQEWGKVYAQDPSFADVTGRLGLAPSTPPSPPRPDQ